VKTKRINSRTKGKNGELEAVRLLRPFFPNCKRSFGQARSGKECPDIINTGQYWIEVKRRKAFTPQTLWSAWTKALDDWGKSSRYLVMMYRADREKWRVWVCEQDIGWTMDGPFKDFVWQTESEKVKDGDL